MWLSNLNKMQIGRCSIHEALRTDELMGANYRNYCQRAHCLRLNGSAGASEMEIWQQHLKMANRGVAIRDLTQRCWWRVIISRKRQ